jgi:hypothetical protein
MVTFFKGTVMFLSVFSAVNQVAAIYGRPAMDRAVVDLYRQATGIERDEDFVRRLLELLSTSKVFPVPADFAKADAQAASRASGFADSEAIA